MLAGCRPGAHGASACLLFNTEDYIEPPMAASGRFCHDSAPPEVALPREAG